MLLPNFRTQGARVKGNTVKTLLQQLPEKEGRNSAGARDVRGESLQSWAQITPPFPKFRLRPGNNSTVSLHSVQIQKVSRIRHSKLFQVELLGRL